MSASKYRWTPACDGQPCVGDCDLCRVDNLQSGIYTDNPDDTLRYVQTTVPVDLWGNPKLADDYVEVIRCKKCEHWNEKTHVCAQNHLFERWAEDDFCSFGERKEK